MDRASDCVRIALFLLEHTFNETFRSQLGVCRFNANSDENSVLFTALFRHAQMSCMMGCPTVSAAISLLLLSLDLIGDPAHVLLCLDFYLLASNNHATIDQIMSADTPLPLGVSPYHLHPNISEQHLSSVLDLLNWNFSYAISLFLRGQHAQADVQLQKSLSTFPFALHYILNKADISPDSYSPLDWRKVCSHTFFHNARERYDTL